MLSEITADFSEIFREADEREHLRCGICNP